MHNSTKPQSSTVILINRNGMGSSDPELQLKLIRTYFTMLIENQYFPSAICFYTEGVKLVAEGSHVLDLLSKLEEMGVRLIVCSTCLNYYQLLEKLKVGIAGGMSDILEAQWKASKVITL